MAAKQVRPVTSGNPNCNIRWSRRPEKLPALNPRMVTAPTVVVGESPASPSKDRAAAGQRQESVKQIGADGGVTAGEQSVAGQCLACGTAAHAADGQRRVDSSGEGKTRAVRAGAETVI